jgi:hypothetical protein
MTMTRINNNINNNIIDRWSGWKELSKYKGSICCFLIFYGFDFDFLVIKFKYFLESSPYRSKKYFSNCIISVIMMIRGLEERSR